MNDILPHARKNPPVAAAAVIFIVGALTIAGFFFFQYGLDLAPCPLCLEQRNAFYVSVPLAALLWLGAGYGANRKVLLFGFLVIATVMLWNTGLASYHAGIEWKFWPGPQDCSGPIDNFGSAQDMLKRLNNISLVRCDAAAWRFLGLSLAGWDVLVSLGLACIALWAAVAIIARNDAEKTNDHERKGARTSGDTCFISWPQTPRSRRTSRARRYSNEYVGIKV